MEISNNEKLEIYQKGIVEGQKHQKPSPDTLIKFEKFEGKMQLLEQKMDFIVSGINDIKETLKNQSFASLKDLEEVDKKIEKLNSRGWLFISTIILIVLERIIEFVLK